MSDTTLTNPFCAQLDIQHMLSTSPPPQDNVLPGLLAGTVGMLAGPGGVGKTMFELQVALAVACGGSICGGLFDGHASDVRLSRQPGRVVMVAAEAVCCGLADVRLDADKSIRIRVWEAIHFYGCAVLWVYADA